MTHRLSIRPEACADLAHAHAWYTAERPGLGDEFQRAVGLTFSLITQAPEAMPVAYRGARRALLRRFPYAVYFVAVCRIQPPPPGARRRPHRRR